MGMSGIVPAFGFFAAGCEKTTNADAFALYYPGRIAV
jgi:hypothetical protein